MNTIILRILFKIHNDIIQWLVYLELDKWVGGLVIQNITPNKPEEVLLCDWNSTMSWVCQQDITKKKDDGHLERQKSEKNRVQTRDLQLQRMLLQKRKKKIITEEDLKWTK